MELQPPSAEAVAALAPTGVLRAAINESNFLLVTGSAENGSPIGPSPDMARALAAHLGVPVDLVMYASPGSVADSASEGVWDICNIGAQPQRAVHTNFTPAYAEIEATLMVPAECTAVSLADLDRPGSRIAVKDRAAYCLWLERNIKHAELVKVDSHDAALEAFLTKGLEANTGLRPRLTSDLLAAPSSRLLDGSFMAVQQSMGTPKDRKPAGFAFLQAFVQHAKASGFVAQSIERHGVVGQLSVAPL